MNKSKIKKLQRELASMQKNKGNISWRDMEKFAKRCGRKRIDQGDEPTYVSELLPNQKPISIPAHRGTLREGTAGNILDALEDDLFLLEEMFRD